MDGEESIRYSSGNPATSRGAGSTILFREKENQDGMAIDCAPGLVGRAYGHRLQSLAGAPGRDHLRFGGGLGLRIQSGADPIGDFVAPGAVLAGPGASVCRGSDGVLLRSGRHERITAAPGISHFCFYPHGKGWEAEYTRIRRRKHSSS